MKNLLLNTQQELYGWIFKQIQVEDVHGKLETQLQIVSLFKNLSNLWKLEEDLSEYMQVHTCGMKSLAANKYVPTSNLTHYGMPVMMERNPSMIIIQTNLEDGKNQQ